MTMRLIFACLLMIGMPVIINIPAQSSPKTLVRSCHLDRTEDTQMSFINELYDKIGDRSRYELKGLPKVPSGYEWLLYQHDGTVFVELYFPDPLVCSYGQIDSTNPEDVLAYAHRVFDDTFSQ